MGVDSIFFPFFSDYPTYFAEGSLPFEVFRERDGEINELSFFRVCLEFDEQSKDLVFFFFLFRLGGVAFFARLGEAFFVKWTWTKRLLSSWQTFFAYLHKILSGKWVKIFSYKLSENFKKIRWSFRENWKKSSKKNVVDRKDRIFNEVCERKNSRLCVPDGEKKKKFWTLLFSLKSAANLGQAYGRYEVF